MNWSIYRIVLKMSKTLFLSLIFIENGESKKMTGHKCITYDLWQPYEPWHLYRRWL